MVIRVIYPLENVFILSDNIITFFTNYNELYKKGFKLTDYGIHGPNVLENHEIDKKYCENLIEEYDLSNLIPSIITHAKTVTQGYMD